MMTIPLVLPRGNNDKAPLADELLELKVKLKLLKLKVLIRSGFNNEVREISLNHPRDKVAES